MKIPIELVNLDLIHFRDKLDAIWQLEGKMQSTSKVTRIVMARNAYFYLSRLHFGTTYRGVEITSAVKRDHATLIHSQKSINNDIKTNNLNDYFIKYIALYFDFTEECPPDWVVRSLSYRSEVIVNISSLKGKIKELVVNNIKERKDTDLIGFLKKYNTELNNVSEHALDRIKIALNAKIDFELKALKHH